MITRWFQEYLLSGCVLGLVLSAAGPRLLHAAEAEPTASLEEIVVTAQRRPERLQDVPITISNLSAEALAQANAQSLSDLQQLVPGFRLDNQTGIYQPTIRGISTSIQCAGCGSNAGIYIDGFLSPHTMSLDSQLFNVESIQVLKGPQGTLFGRNTVAGAVQINTSAPSTTTQGFLESSYGSFDTQKYQAYATTGLSDRVALDVGGSISKSNGWTTNIFTHNDDFGRYDNWTVRTGLKVTVTEDLSLLFRYEHVSFNDPNGTAPVPFVLNGQILAYGPYLPGATVATGPGLIAVGGTLQKISKQDDYQLTGSWDFGLGTLKSYSQYRKDVTPLLQNSYDFASLPILDLDIPDYQRTLTQEFIVTSKPGGVVEWTAGAFYYNSTESYRNITESLFGAPSFIFASTGADDKSAAVYGDTTYKVSNFFLTAGVRYTRDQTTNAFWDLPTSGRTTLPTLSTDRVTPRAVVRYALNSESNVYASFSRGYKAAIYNTGGFTAVPVQPEGMSAYEVGYKYASQKTSVDLSSFYYDYTNEQVTSQEFKDGVAQTVITNAASSKMYGVDAELQYKLFDSLALDVGAEWLHAHYTDYPDAVGFMVTPEHLLPAITVNASGYHMERSPDFTANVGATYTTGVAKGKLALSANVYYSSEFYFDPAQQLPQSSYTTLGARAAWTDASGRYEIAVGGNNVTHAEYYTAAWQNIFGAGAIWATPATYYGSVRIRFP
jgi:iron complex outermembrane recepter protein